MDDINKREIARALRLFVAADGVGELRAIGCGDRKRTVSIYFAGNEVNEMARKAAKISATAKGVYIVMNRFPSEFLDRSPQLNNQRQNAREATKDVNITRRDWLLIDFDPKSSDRSADDSATDEEKATAYERMETVRKNLDERGFPNPVVADSGNGWHLLYRCDLPNDIKSRDLVKRFLAELSRVYSDNAVEIDTSVFNASRITKLYGTLARKGSDQPKRAHRVSRIITLPKVLTPVKRKLIQQIIEAGQPITADSISGSRLNRKVASQSPASGAESNGRSQVPELIPSGHRHNSLVQIAASVRTIGLTEEEIFSTLTAVTQRRMEVELPEDEVREIARWAADQRPNEVLNARVRGRPEEEIQEAERRQQLRLRCEQLQRQLEMNATSSEIILAMQRLINSQSVNCAQPLETITSAELARRQYNLEYLIPNLLVKGQPCVLAGPKKCLKTNLLIDLSLSIATGTSFLNHFPIPQARRVALLSGESGAATIQETALRVARSKKNSQLRDAVNALWCFGLPKLGQPSTVRTLVNYINQHKLEVICIDPAYLCMPIGDAAGNLFVVGQMLADLSQVTDETGVTVVLAHHSTKSSSSKDKRFNQFATPELEHIAWSGFQEWARQWLLLARRESYDPELVGYHKIWLAAGGSAGHSGLWGVDIQEGNQRDPHGRRWQITIKTATAIRTAQQAEVLKSRNINKTVAENAKLERDRKTALRAYRMFPNGETEKQLKSAAGMNGDRWGVINARLLQQRTVEKVSITKNGRRYDGFRLLDISGTSGTDRDRPSQPGDGGGAGQASPP